MPPFIDARIPVVFAPPAQAGPDDVVLTLGDAPAAAHPAGCACCVPRGAAARALARLFLARAKGEMPFFRRVVVAEGAEAVAEAVRNDPAASGWYRLG